MPLPKGTQFGRRGKVRLAFKSGKVIETKNMETGETHTPAEFAEDRRKPKASRSSKEGYKRRLARSSK